MRGTLILLSILLLLWIGGSSYWYVCKINGHCNSEQMLTGNEDSEDETLTINEAESQDPEPKESEAEVKTGPGTLIDSVALAVEYLQKAPSRAIFFAYAKYETDLSEDDSEYFEMLRIYLENEPDKKIYVTGHSDTSGTPEGLIYASYQRLLFITRALVNAGIPEARMQSKSLGEGFPAESNLSSVGRAKNRRVEITIRNPFYHE